MAIALDHVLEAAQSVRSPDGVETLLYLIVLSGIDPQSVDAETAEEARIKLVDLSCSYPSEDAEGRTLDLTGALRKLSEAQFQPSQTAVT